MKRITLLCLLLLQFCINLLCSTDISSIHLTTDNGLSNNSISYLFQDSKGFVWACTLNGLNRYDGNSFLIYQPKQGSDVSLAGHYLRKVEEDKHGFLWIYTSQETYNCYDLQHDCFVDFTGCGESNQFYNSRLEDSSGNVWLWHWLNGCRKITYSEGKFSSISYKKELGNLPSSYVRFVIESIDGEIWIGTTEGLCRIKENGEQILEKNGSFVHAMNYNEQLFFISNQGEVYCKKVGKPLILFTAINMQIGSTDHIVGFNLKEEWIIFTLNKGYAINLISGELSKKNPLDIKKGDFIEDNRGNYWVYNATGVLRYVNAETAVIKYFHLISSEQLGYAVDERYTVLHDSEKGIWISTYGNGLYHYDTLSEELNHYTCNAEGSNSINSNYILSMMEDNAKNIWIGTEFRGISILSKPNLSAQYVYVKDKQHVDRSNTIRKIAQIEDETVLVGTRRGDLYTYNLTFNKQLKQEHYAASIYAIAKDSKGREWLGSRGSGLSINGEWYLHQRGENYSISANNIFDITEDDKGRIWIAILDGGINLASQESNGKYIFRHFFNDFYSQQQMRTIIQDRKGWMWVGSDDGVYVFHPDSLIADATSYYVYNFNNGKLPSNVIKSIYCDRHGDIWIGTAGGGLCHTTNQQDYSELKFTTYTVDDGLANNMVQSSIEDQLGNLWIGTEYGLSRLNLATKVIDNFFFSAQMMGNVYSENSACRLKDGRLLFGTDYGMVVMDPASVKTNKSHTTITLTQLKINGITVHPGEKDSPLTRALSYTEYIELNYDLNSFSIDFSTLNFSIPNTTKYSYLLEPYDKNWSIPSELNFAAYKNLSPGKYRLRIKALNTTGDKVENEKLLTIVVTPPIWQTYWAYLTYMILASLLLYFSLRLFNRFNNLRNRIRVEKQLSEYKLTFFTGVSHEFRTPLTLIQGALEKVNTQMEKMPKELIYSIQIMDKSTRRMLQLINQLLEFRKVEDSERSMLSLEEAEVISFVHDIFTTFTEMAESKEIHYSFRSTVASYGMFIEKGMMDKIMYNLLSNALKYTPKGGEVSCVLKFDEVQQQLVIQIIDTGCGISKERRKSLFNSFMQSNFETDSMGVGLHMTYGLVQKLLGTLTYEENKQAGSGSIFQVTLPLVTTVYKETDFLKNRLSSNLSPKEKLYFVAEDGEERKINPLNPKRILIIEDDPDIRSFLEQELANYFEVVTEPDGIAGFERANCYEADLIVSDVLMPGMTGLELTRRLKNNFATSHTPIILLTAMTGSEYQLEGTENGADAYLMKPFSTKLLLARIFQLIDQREKLCKKYSNDPTILRPNVCTSTADKEFSDKLLSILDNEMTNVEFTIEDWAAKLNLGRTLFFRKVKGVTGYSPNELIRVVRMKRAVELLAENRYNVSEVSYLVGINDPFYFSRCFKAQFGESPSAYLKRIRGEE